MTQFSINVTNFWLRPSTVSITENLSRSLDVIILKPESDDTRYFISSDWLNKTGFDLKKTNAIETLVSLPIMTRISCYISQKITSLF